MRRVKWKWYAKKLLKLSEKMAVKYSDIVIGDNKGITDYIKSKYSKTVKNKRVELIAYGGDQISRVQDDSLFEKYPFCREPYSVTVCRIEPENNVHVILEAFSEMLDETLVFVGNWEKSEYGRSLKEKFSACKNILLIDPIYEPHTVRDIPKSVFTGKRQPMKKQSMLRNSAKCSANSSAPQPR